MAQKLFNICNIIASDESDYQTLLEYLGNYPVSITREFPDELYFEAPTLVIGWNFIKNKFQSQNIFDKKITQNLHWSFSKSEKEKDFFSDVEKFFSDSVKKWLPQNFTLFDSYLNKESISDFIASKIKSDKKMFVYFHDGAMYVYNDGNNFVINIKSLSIYESNFKNVITDILNNHDVVVFSYNNLSGYVNMDRIKNVIAIDTLRWVKYGVETLDNYFNIIPGFNMQKYIPFLMGKLRPIELDFEEQAFYKRMCERDKITCWLSTREIAFDDSFDNKKLEFKIRRGHRLAKVNYSDKRTITGRIASRDVYNPQNLDKSNDDRKHIISRFGSKGSILVFDYVSFETKISMFLSEDINFIEEYHDEDLHLETAFLLFENDDITPEQRDFSKILNHSLLYGAGEDTLLKKLSEHFKNPSEQLYKIRKLFKPIIDKSDEIKQIYKDNGYIINPWGSIIRSDKAHASFNNYIQSYASEIVVDKLFEIRKFLSIHKTQFLFQVHDSLVFDLHPTEHFLIDEIYKILEQHKDMFFRLNYSIGPNYKELK